ncbi:hypothetical protein CRG98_015824 [Punica granatum]|uniref:DUF7745 domain-containing protein n=1 Tax=Punica granatum TaxID=22663 RepID=A0A2I0K6R2_PUNGR|nr:hypothetical protein CRG98_015824 [Punica granatum]
MDRSAPGLKLEAITLPRLEILRIWRTFRPVDRAFVQDIIGDVVMLTEAPVDWIFLRTATEFWDPQHAVIAWLSDWTLLRALTPSTASYQHDACHGFLLLIFGTLLFPYTPNRIDGAIAQVVLQAVGGHSYVEALLAETIRALDYVREVRRGRMRGSPHLLQVWLLAHIRHLCSSHPFSYIADERLLIERLVPVFPPPERSFSEWRHFWHELTPARFLWVARWNPGGPMITGCPGIVGVPLLNHLGSTLIIPGRVIRQLGDLQDIPTEADRLPYRIQWADSTSMAPGALDGVSSSTRSNHDLGPGDGPLKRYVGPSAGKGARGPPPLGLADALILPSLGPTLLSAGHRAQRDVGLRLCSFFLFPMAEEDRVDVSKEVNPPAPAHSQPPLTRAPPPLTPAGVLPAYSGAPSTHLPPPTSSGALLLRASLTSPASDDHARIAALKGTINQLAASMTTNMAELFALLRGPNRASSSSTPPPGQGPTVDPTRPSTTDSVPHFGSGHVCTPTCSHAGPSRSLYHPSVDGFSSAKRTYSNSPSSCGTPSYPPLQPHTNFPYQAPPPINTTFLEPGTPTHAAQFASPTHFLPQVDAEQERRLNERMQMRLDPTRAMVIAVSSQACGYPRNSRSRSSRPMKAEDIPTWADLSRKFIDQYQYCAETLPTPLKLSMKEMAHGQRFEEYATKWRAQAAKHIPPISEVQQIQLFHSTLRGVYYSHLLAHTSSFSDLIEAGKKLDLGIKLAGWKAPPIKERNPRRRPPQCRLLLVEERGRRLRERIQEMINAKELVFNVVRSPNVQANPLPDHGPARGPSINMITVCTPGEGESEQGCPSPFVIEYVPAEAAVGFTGIDAPLAPFVIDVPAREP